MSASAASQNDIDSHKWTENHIKMGNYLLYVSYFLVGREVGLPVHIRACNDAISIILYKVHSGINDSGIGSSV